VTSLIRVQEEYIRKLAEKGGEVTPREEADILRMISASIGSNYWRMREQFEEGVKLLHELRKEQPKIDSDIIREAFSKPIEEARQKQLEAYELLRKMQEE